MLINCSDSIVIDGHTLLTCVTMTFDLLDRKSIPDQGAMSSCAQILVMLHLPMSQEEQNTVLLAITLWNINQFSNSFTNRLSSDYI